MPVITIPSIGSVGLMKDENPFSLPINAITDCLNVRPNGGALETFQPGKAVTSAMSVNPQYFDVLSRDFSVYSDSTDLYLYQNGLHTKITRTSGTYSSSEWSSCVQQGFAVLVNETDTPQALYPLDSSFTSCVDLPNWPAGYTTRTMCSFKNILIAGNITESGVNYPGLLKWSHPADPGAAPVTWDPTDATHLAGEESLGDDNGEIMVIRRMGERAMAYKGESAYAIDYVGAPYVFVPRKVSSVSGALSRRSVTEFKNGLHFVAGDDDIVVHTGSNPTSVLDARIRRWLFADIDSNNYLNTFTLVNPKLNECWFCYPSSGSTYCDKALVWNYTDNATSVIDLPNVVGGIYSDVPITGITWDTPGTTWDTPGGPWNNSLPYWAFLASNTDKSIYAFEDSLSLVGGSASKYVERTGWAWSLAPQGPYRDEDTYKYLDSMRFNISANSGCQLTLTVGSQDYLNGPITWRSGITFDPSVTRVIDSLDISGVYLAYKLESSGTDWWRLNSLDMEVTPIARY